jgi:excisionase family DNA binding protein
MQNEDELFDVKYVAALLHVNQRTVLRMVERKELPAIMVSRRFRFRRSDLDNYLRTHLYPSSSSQNGKTARHIIPETVELSQEAEQEVSDVPTQPGDVASESTLKEQTRSLGAQSAKLRKQAAQLEIEKQWLALRREDLGLIDQALATADRIVNMLQPEADAKTKASLLQTLLPSILQPGQSRSLESALSVLKIDAEEETAATN